MVPTFSNQDLTSSNDAITIFVPNFRFYVYPPLGNYVNGSWYPAYEFNKFLFYTMDDYVIYTSLEGSTIRFNPKDIVCPDQTCYNVL